MLVSWDERLRRHPGLAGAVLFLFAFLAFSSSLANRFVFDDLLQILQNPFVMNPRLWAKNFTTSSFGFTGATTNFYRPLQFFSYWLICCLDARQLSFPLLAARFDYLPSAGLCLALGFAGVVWLPRRVPHGVLVPALALTAILWVVQVQRLIPSYRDNQAMWSYSAEVAPDAPLVHLYEAEIRFNRHDFEGAGREYQTALRLNQASFRPLLGVAFDSYTGLGRIAERQNRLQEAPGYYEKAVSIAPHHAEGYRHLGALYFPRGDYVRSAKYFVQAVQLNPQDLEARFYLGTCWMKLAKYREAAEQFRVAREMDPTYWQAFAAEARALDAAGDSDGAARARRLMPKHMPGEP